MIGLGGSFSRSAELGIGQLNVALHLIGCIANLLLLRLQNKQVKMEKNQQENMRMITKQYASKIRPGKVEIWKKYKEKRRMEGGYLGVRIEGEVGLEGGVSGITVSFDQ